MQTLVNDYKGKVNSLEEQLDTVKSRVLVNKVNLETRKRVEDGV